MRKTKNYGDPIELYWWDGDPDYYLVRGHLPPEKAAKILAEFWMVADYEIELDTPQPMWAQWHWCWMDGERQQMLELYPEKRRGRFPVMCADVQNDSPEKTFFELLAKNDEEEAPIDYGKIILNEK